MNAVGRTPAVAGLWAAALLTGVSLGVRWNAFFSGYRLDVRVLLIGAIAALVVAARGTRPRRGRALATSAIGLLGLALALHLRSIEPTPLFLLTGAIVATVVARSRLPRADAEV